MKGVVGAEKILRQLFNQDWHIHCSFHNKREIIWDWIISHRQIL